MDEARTCINCGRPLIQEHGAWFCPVCNSDRIDTSFLSSDQNDESEFVFIECHGATLYKEGSNEVAEGVEFLDNNDPAKGLRIVGHPVYAPEHRHRRRIRRDALGRIRRCQACQDYTVRMRRKEGRDFFIPSPRHPHRTQLKPTVHVTREPYHGV